MKVFKILRILFSCYLEKYFIHFYSFRKFFVWNKILKEEKFPVGFGGKDNSRTP